MTESIFSELVVRDAPEASGVRALVGSRRRRAALMRLFSGRDTSHDAALSFPPPDPWRTSRRLAGKIMHQSMRGQVALVSGGASGIGLGLGTALLEAGCRVAVCDIRADHMESARARLTSHRDDVLLCRLDVASASDWASARRAILDRWGALHALFLNAGVGVLGSMLASRPGDWDWIMSVNLAGVTLGIEAMLPLVRAQGKSGHVCATSSMGGLMVADDGAVYSSAKFAVVALMECLAADLAAEGVGVSVLCPAAVNTNIHDHASMRPERHSDSGLLLGAAEQAEAQARARAVLSMGADPVAVGRWVVSAMQAGERYLFTDGSVWPALEWRCKSLLAAAGGVQ
jgi:NAD(P)-dependent dehydrogenase (short-subunit alcohol dehydrogenase family)